GITISAAPKIQTLVDQVATKDKPSGRITCSGSGYTTLQIVAGTFDRQIDLTNTTSETGSIMIADATDGVSVTDVYRGVTHLLIHTNDYVAADASGGTTVSVSGVITNPSLTVDTGLGMYDTINLDHCNNVEVHTG